MNDRAAKRTGYPLTIPDALLNSEPMRTACATRDFAEVFRLVNRRTGTSQADMAAAIGKMTSSRISDVIRGVRGIRGRNVIERIADAFGIPGHMLDLPSRPWENFPENGESRETLPLWDSVHEKSYERVDAHLPTVLDLAASARECVETDGFDEMMRREFLRLIGITGVVMHSPNFPAPANGPQGTYSDDTADTGPMNSALWQVFSLSTSKRTVYPAVAQQLRGIAQKMGSTRERTTHRGLCASAGDLFQLAGEIQFDSNRYMDAAHSYALAANASKEAGNFDLWACSLTRHAFIEMYEKNYSQASPLLDAAEHVARRGDSHMSTRYWVAAVQAEVFAQLGDFDACNRALDRAEQVQTLAGPIHNGGWLRFDGSRLAEERGTCYIALGRHDLAESALLTALKQPLSLRRRGGVLTDLASLGIHRRDIDQLLTHALAAIELAKRTRSDYIKRRIEGLENQLSSITSDRRILDLRQEISALGAID